MPVITVTEMKAHLNVTLDADDALIADKIAAAELHLERFTGKAFLNQTLTASFDAFPSAIELPRAPVQSVDSIVYVDTDRVEQTLDAADYFTSPAGVIYPAIGKSFPSTANVAGALTVTYTAGYGETADDVPEPLREAVRQYAAHLYENREAVLVGVNAQELPMGVFMLVLPYKRWAF